MKTGASRSVLLNTLKLLAILVVLIFIGGCVSIGEATREYVYVNPNVPSTSVNLRLQIDSGNCLQRTYTMPLPDGPQLGGLSGIDLDYAIKEHEHALFTAMADRQQVFDGCMTVKGYEKVVSVEQ